MNTEQVHIEVMHAQLTVNTPAEEKDTLLQAVEMLNRKAEAIREGGRVADSEKIVIMAALNVVHDLLKISLNGDLAIGDFERKITDMSNACQKALTRLVQE
ncbi:cell division protein ZapA [Neisseria cinerea]|uniref:Cell division protein ZapA n=1 Tax=Neisseria cinerea ATCC 14685 TaxID=546262 RepID=D0W485_NEICI|nr:cell division protein ZapA [Neisseria cinerea]EEZ71407.1 cell division protein ZapA [Neisseria cinerea ATCC 14685]MCD2070909.1 cell division protein ZapA [Neisseria cinerea]